MAESLLSAVKTPIWSRNQHLRFLFMSNLTIADQKIVGRIENAMAFDVTSTGRAQRKLPGIGGADAFSASCCVQRCATFDLTRQG